MTATEPTPVCARGGDVDGPFGNWLSYGLVPLVRVAFGAFAKLLGFSDDVIAFLGNAVLALIVGLLRAYVLCRRTLGMERTDKAMGEGFPTTGEILLATGIGGSLGAVVNGTGLTVDPGDLQGPDDGHLHRLGGLLADRHGRVARRPALGRHRALTAAVRAVAEARADAVGRHRSPPGGRLLCAPPPPGALRACPGHRCRRGAVPWW